MSIKNRSKSFIFINKFEELEVDCTENGEEYHKRESLKLKPEESPKQTNSNFLGLSSPKKLQNKFELNKDTADTNFDFSKISR